MSRNSAAETSPWQTDCRIEPLTPMSVAENRPSVISPIWLSEVGDDPAIVRLAECEERAVDESPVAASTRISSR